METKTKRRPPFNYKSASKIELAKELKRRNTLIKCRRHKGLTSPCVLCGEAIMLVKKANLNWYYVGSSNWCAHKMCVTNVLRESKNLRWKQIEEVEKLFHQDNDELKRILTSSPEPKAIELKGFDEDMTDWFSISKSVQDITDTLKDIMDRCNRIVTKKHNSYVIEQPLSQPLKSDDTILVSLKRELEVLL